MEEVRFQGEYGTDTCAHELLTIFAGATGRQAVLSLPRLATRATPLDGLL